MRKYTILGGYGLLALVLDQLTKWWAVAAIDPLQPVTLIPGLLDLVLVHNRGAAFGFLNRSDIQWQFWLFLGATVVAAVAIVALLRSSRFNAWLSAGLGLVLGGVAALAVCFVFLLVASAAISGGLAGEELMYQLTIVGCVLGAFAGGLLAVRRCGSRALIVGLTTGGVLFLLLLTIGALCFETVSLEAGGIGLLCGSLCGGAAAGILGGGGKKKPARKKRRK